MNISDSKFLDVIGKYFRDPKRARAIFAQHLNGNDIVSDDGAKIQTKRECLQDFKEAMERRPAVLPLKVLESFFQSPLPKPRTTFARTSFRKPTLDELENRRDRTGQYAGKYGSWQTE